MTPQSRFASLVISILGFIMICFVLLFALVCRMDGPETPKSYFASLIIIAVYMVTKINRTTSVVLILCKTFGTSMDWVTRRRRDKAV